MLNYVLSGAAIGIMGSFHCIGMCGPLALSLPIHGATTAQKTGHALLYNIGRASSYAILGGIFGTIGNQFTLFGWQQGLSIMAGIFLLIALFGLPYIQRISTFQQYNTWVKQHLSTLLQSKTKAATSYWLIGVLNGLLPCGLVYVAVAAAIATGSWWGGSLLMLSFGFGTIPLLLTLMLTGNFISFSWRKKINKITPVFTFALAILLIVRGLNLGIPYLSPAFDTNEHCVKHCCHK